MRILFDSRNIEDKTPFGTLQTGQSCLLRIRIPVSAGATGVRLMLEDCENRPAGEFPFIWEKKEDEYDVYRCTFVPAERGLYYYWFYVIKKEGGFRLFRQGNGTNMEAGDKWQLSVIPADFTTPDFAKGAIMYQILPDRFHKSGECDLTEKLQPYSVHAHWEESPNFTADKDGNWCTDFFGGNLRGIREKLPYLKGLGVGVLYLNPIFMAFSNHRYDTANYKRVDPMLGTNEDFTALCEAAHALDMRVILDGVFSHTGSNSVYFDAKHIFGHGAVSDPNSPYRSWYRFHHYPDSYECWWNMPTLPNVEEMTQSYVDYIIESEDSVVAHWLRLGADGFRLDVVDELPDAFVRRLKERIRAIRPDALLIGEVWEDASNKRAYSESRRYFVDGELDSVMNYPWRTAIIRFVLGEDDGAVFGETVMSIAENYPPQVLACVMNLLSTHDTPRIVTALGAPCPSTKEEKSDFRMDAEAYGRAVGRELMAAFLQFTLPGMPSIFYGDEAGLEGFEDPFCRRCFPWGREDRDLTAFYRDLASLKRNTPALHGGQIRVVTAGGGRLSFTRSAEGQTARIFVNHTDRPWSLPEGELRFGWGIYRGESGVALQPGGFCLLV